MAYTNNQLHVIYGDGSLGLQGLISTTSSATNVADLNHSSSTIKSGSIVHPRPSFGGRQPIMITVAAFQSNPHSGTRPISSQLVKISNWRLTTNQSHRYQSRHSITNTRITKSPRKSLWLTTSLPRPFLVPSSQWLIRWQQTVRSISPPIIAVSLICQSYPHLVCGLSCQLPRPASTIPVCPVRLILTGWLAQHTGNSTLTVCQSHHTWSHKNAACTCKLNKWQ